MAELGAVTRALLAIASEAADDRVLAEQVCRACVEGLDIDGAAISLLTDTNLRETLCATDTTAELLEDLQFSLGEGPCVQAALTGRPVLVSDLHHSPQVSHWPIFAGVVMEQSDVRALFTVPMRWGTTIVGVLDLYRTAPGPLSAVQLRDTASAADIAALMILWVRTDPGEGQLPDHSMHGRVEIHRATGVVMVELGVSALDALARMRAHAFAEQRLLSDVAHDVLSGRLHFTRDTI